jgi:hypothetical protein
MTYTDQVYLGMFYNSSNKIHITKMMSNNNPNRKLNMLFFKNKLDIHVNKNYTNY